MRSPFNIFNVIKYKGIIFQESRRFAGHSKWSNIKHTKAAIDAERASLFRSLTSKMRAAIIEGGSMKPSENQKLAFLIDQAKKANMPISTLNSFFDKMAAAKNKSQTTTFEVRGPGGCILIIHVSSNNLVQTKLEILSKLKKANAKIVESAVKNIFECRTYIIGEKKCNLDKAMEDAIEAGAEDVEEIEEDGDKYFKFKCEIPIAKKVEHKLQTLDYSIISAIDECIPNITVNLNEDDTRVTELLKARLLALDGVDRIDDNIA